MKIIDADKLVEELNNPRTKYEAIINLPPRATRKDIVDTVLKAYRNILFEMINDQPVVNEWISCSERMPEVSDWYMVSIKDAEVEIMAHYIKTTNKFEDRDYFGEMVEVQNVVAWRYRQPAYKED